MSEPIEPKYAPFHTLRNTELLESAPDESPEGYSIQIPNGSLVALGKYPTEGSFCVQFRCPLRATAPDGATHSILSFGLTRNAAEALYTLLREML